MDSLNVPQFPKGSRVLVTGANGFLGSHITDQFLHYGYKVRGVVRDIKRNAWLAELFEKKYGKDAFELFQVSDLDVESSLEEAMKGVSIVAHTVTAVTFDSNPHNVIPIAIAGATNVLKAAYRQASVKRFVYSSSSTAAVTSGLGQAGAIITENSWNLDAIEAAWADPPYTEERAWTVYAASKAQAEQDIWRYHEENCDKRPDLSLNTVLPTLNFGKILDPINQGFPSTSGLPVALWNGEVNTSHKGIVRQYYVDVQDTARLHVAAATFVHVKDQRIFASAGRFNWDCILNILRKHQPDRNLPEDFSGGDDPDEIEPRVKAEQLLRDLGRSGWTSLEESILKNIENA